MPREKATSLKSRLRTFKANGWKCPYLNVLDLAYAGFSMDLSGSADDAVVCDFCNKALESWSESDVPSIEHKKHSPFCILFESHMLEARILSFKYAALSISGSSMRALAVNGLFLYNIKDSRPHMLCFNCGFSCTIIGEDAHKVGPRIRELHAWHNKDCLSDINALTREREENESFIIDTTDYPIYQIISRKIDLKSIPKYTIRLVGQPHENIQLEIPGHPIRVMSSSNLPRPSNQFTWQKTVKNIIPAELVTSTEASVHNTFSAPESDSTVSIYIPEITAAPVQTLEHTSADKNKTTIEVPNEESHPDPLAKQNSAEVYTEHPVEKASGSELLLELGRFLTDEEKRTVPLKDALSMALKKMLAHLREITSHDIEAVRQEISNMLP